MKEPTVRQKEKQELVSWSINLLRMLALSLEQKDGKYHLLKSELEKAGWKIEAPKEVAA